MANPIDDLHSFDLHVHVGTRSWPDDVEEYCQVTYPGAEQDTAITINYIHYVGSLHDAIRVASEDIRRYMTNPEAWIRRYLREHGTEWEKLRGLEREMARYAQDIEEYQSILARRKQELYEVEQEASRLRVNLAEGDEAFSSGKEKREET